MKDYPLTNSEGRRIGRIQFDYDDIPQALKGDLEYRLTCSWLKDTGEIVDVSVVPVPAKTEREQAIAAYPDHHPETALVNWRAGREVFDTNGDMR